MTDQARERYRLRKSEHRCVRCGARLPEKYNMVYCGECREQVRKISMERKPRHTEPAPGTLTISQVVRLAAERHISYGEMVQILEKEGYMV